MTAAQPHDCRLWRGGEQHALVCVFCSAVFYGQFWSAGYQWIRGRIHGDPGSFQANFWYAFLAGLTLILGAAYSLWLVKRVIFGAVGNQKVGQPQGHQRT